MATRGTGFIEFDIVGNQRGVQAMLERIDSALSPTGLAAFMGLAVGPWVKERAQSRFAQEGDDVTGKWAPLADATVEIREHAGFEGSHPINKRTGELEEFITQGQIGVVSTPGLTVMTYPKDPPAGKGIRQKMETAQVGRSFPSTKPRPVLGLNRA